MKLKPLKFSDAFEIKLDRLQDERGFFMRFYDSEIFGEFGLQTEWMQESVSFNRWENTIRGLHFQYPPFAETKIVRLVAGAVLDVLLDLRQNSETYGECLGIELTADNDTAVYIPKGVAHGFRTLSENTILEYKIDVPYKSDLAGGIRWNDNALEIDWGKGDPIVSERDTRLSRFSEFESPF